MQELLNLAPIHYKCAESEKVGDDDAIVVYFLNNKTESSWDSLKPCFDVVKLLSLPALIAKISWKKKIQHQALKPEEFLLS